MTGFTVVWRRQQKNNLQTRFSYSMLNVLALCSYPIEAAATRYRLFQFVEPLAERGINLIVRPFLSSKLFASLYQRNQLHRTMPGLLWATLARLSDLWRVHKADVVLVQREAMMLGPPLIEWLAKEAGRCPLVLDLDDATYVSYDSPTFGHLASKLKWFSKTDDLIRWAEVVTCGNRTIAAHVSALGSRAVIIPTVVDTNQFVPAAKNDDGQPPVIGWIGTHSTFPYLESIFPVIQELARSFSFCLKIVGAGRGQIVLDGVEVKALEWSLEREIKDFQSFDIGLYPMATDNWASGKSGFKAIQYMAVGIPYVVTPFGATTEIGRPDVTHFAAASPSEWKEKMSQLLIDPQLRKKMGAAGRQYALEHYTVASQADKLAQALREALVTRPK